MGGARRLFRVVVGWRPVRGRWHRGVVANLGGRVRAAERDLRVWVMGRGARGGGSGARGLANRAAVCEAGGMMEPAEVEALFTRADGQFVFARWGRPIVPVVFGVEDATLGVVKGALEAVVLLADHRMAEVDPELGANLMIFFVAGWEELRDVPGLDRLIPEFAALLARLEAAEANQYRIFRFDAEGAVRAAFVFVRMDAHLRAVPAETLALSQAVQVILLWSDTAFAGASPLLAGPEGAVMLRPEIGALVRAAYAPVLPAHATDPALAYRIAARMEPAA